MSPSSKHAPTPELTAAAKRLYRAEGELEYFAGGHKWSDGTVYQFARQGEAYLLKLIRAEEPGKIEVMAERLRYQEYLGQAGIDIVYPIHSESGNLIESLNLDEPHAVFAWRKVEGEHIQLVDPTALAGFYHAWGGLVGRIHRLAQAYPDWQHSRAVDADGVPLLSRDREWDVFYNWIPDPGVKEAWLDMKARLDTLPSDRNNFGFIHNDPHPGNILVNGQRLTLLDFDVANFMWFVTDLAICIYSEYSRCRFHSGFQHRVPQLPELFLKPWLSGYLEQNQLPAEEFQRLELFLNYRRFLMFTVFYEQIRDGDPDYLERFTQDILAGRRYLDFEITDLIQELPKAGQFSI